MRPSLVVEPDGARPWAERGVYEVVDGVFRIPLPMPGDGLVAVNVYLVQTAAGSVLVDTGQSTEVAWELLVAGLSAVGVGVDTIRAVVVTHAHADHYSNIGRIRSRSGAEVSLHHAESASVSRSAAPDFRGHEPHLQTLQRAGAGNWTDQLAERPEWRTWNPADFEPPDRWLSDGDVICGRLEAVHTPGHTAGHCVFRDSEADVVFTGDHVLPRITPSIGFESVPSRRPLAAYLDSLERVLEFPDATMLPAHGSVGVTVHARATELREHHEGRLAEFRELVRTGARTAQEVAERARWTRRHRTLEQLDLFNRTLAVNETLAHLEVLAMRGDVDMACGSTGVALFR